MFCVPHHRAVKLCAPLQEKVLVSVWSRRIDADMLAGARHSSDQLGFWSHSKSAVVCRCRNRLLSRPERPPGGRRNPSTAIIGCLSLSLSRSLGDWPAGAAPAAPAAGTATVQQAFQHPRAPFGPGAGQLVSSAATVGGREDRGGLAVSVDERPGDCGD